MSKRAYISRYTIIIKKLKQKPYSTYQELQNYIQRELEHLQMLDEDLDIGFSQRTLQRDLKDIRNIFGINIEYSKSNKGYFIRQSEAENMNFQRMMEAFDVFNSLNIAQDLQPFIHLEKRRPQGTENLYGLIHAIKNRLQINFSYQKFWEDKPTERVAEPHALKEFKNRWYVMAKDNKDGIIKSFPLDRLSDFEITKNTFQYPGNQLLEHRYRYCFGIISPDDDEPQDIILSFDPIQGKYIKSLPLHDTQQVLIDNEDGLQVKLKLYITYDLIMELLSYGDRVKVLQPAILADKLKTDHENAFRQYD